LRTILLALLLPFLAAAAPRPTPATVQAWQDRKFGMFIHWGLYSILGGVWDGKQITYGYSEQIQSHAPVPKDDYTALARQFNPVRFDPDAIARLAKAAGMKFIVVTSKHHDGFNMFHTKLSPYNVVDATPYRKDVVKLLAEACRRNGLLFGVYYSTIDWNFPGALPPDVQNNDNLIPKVHEDFNVGQLKELMSNYGPLGEIWFDMGKPTPEQSRRFTDTVHSLQPDCMVSGRVFNHQGDFTVMGDNSIPQFVIDEPWQTPASIYHDTWGYRSWQPREDLPGKTAEHIVKLVEVVSRGGNYLLNIGPRGDGSVVEFEVSILRGIGRWIEANGEAIYGSHPQPFRQLDFGYATVKPGKLFLMVRNWPSDGRLVLPGLSTPIRKAYFLADLSRAPLPVGPQAITLSRRTETPPVTIVVAEYDGPLHVTPPLIQPAPSGVISLTAKQADTFFNYNGRGYFEPPTVYKQQWHFAAPRPGTYKLTLSPSPTAYALELDGRPIASTGAVELNPRPYHTLTVTPPKPFVKGDRLAPPLQILTLTPGA
jgi:alpha-L-fucosidase